MLRNSPECKRSILRSLWVSVPELLSLAIKELCLQCKRRAGSCQAQAHLQSPPLVLGYQFPCCFKNQERNWAGHIGLHLFLNFCKTSSLSLSFSQFQDLQVSSCFWMRQCLPEPPSLICLTLTFLLLLLGFKASGDIQQYLGSITLQAVLLGEESPLLFSRASLWSIHREYPSSRVALRCCIFLGCSFERKGVSNMENMNFSTASVETGQQSSSVALWGAITCCSLIQYLASPQYLDFHLSQCRKLMVLWLPGHQGLLSCSPSLFLKLLFLCGGVRSLFQKIQVLTLPKLHCPGQRDPTLTLDRSCLALQGRSVFLLLPLWSLTLYMLLSAGLQQISGESQWFGSITGKKSVDG